MNIQVRENGDSSALGTDVPVGAINATGGLADQPVLDLQQKLDHLLAKSKPSKREMAQNMFRDLFPKIDQHLKQGKPLKEVLAAFNQVARTRVCLRTFKDMLARARAGRDEHGNWVHCHVCGQSLPVSGGDESALDARPEAQLHSAGGDAQ